jgi:uridine kinase
LSQGQRINVKEYNFNFRDQPSRDIKIDPNPIVIVEGLLTLFFKEIKDLLDVRIFIDAPEHLMLKRRILRDDKERGYNDLGETLYRFEHHVMPAYRKYILPYKSEVDLIIPNSGTVDKSLDVLCGFIQHKFETLTQDK